MHEVQTNLWKLKKFGLFSYIISLPPESMKYKNICQKLHKNVVVQKSIGCKKMWMYILIKCFITNCSYWSIESVLSHALNIHTDHTVKNAHLLTSSFWKRIGIYFFMIAEHLVTGRNVSK